MNSAWDAIDLGRAAGVLALGVILVAAGTSSIPAVASGDVSGLGDFVRLVVAAMLMVGLIGWAWSWIDATAPGR